MHTETYQSVVVYPVKTFGFMEVYERQHHRAWHLPRYVVFHRGGVPGQDLRVHGGVRAPAPHGRALEDFRTRRAALKWAKTNQNG